MFTYQNYVWKSDILALSGVGHGFSTREGGKSVLPHTASMNVGFFRGDDDGVVLRNIALLCRHAGVSEDVVCTPQIHSDIIRRVGKENTGEGSVRDVPFSCDGFVTSEPGVTLLIRVADCTPVLLAGLRADGTPVVGAVHAGWRGTAAGIAPKAVAMLQEMGAEAVYAAVGACIHDCCYEVGADLRDTVASLRGADFAARHVRERDGRLYADIAGMNRELLLGAGAAGVDMCPECTRCNPALYHSHRATDGKRGTMGAVIGILA